MIDSGPQLAGSMEYNVVLSECHIRETRSQSAADGNSAKWKTAKNNETCYDGVQ